MKAPFQLLRRLWKGETFSPEAFVARALVITLFYAISIVAGLQEYTSFLSGTSASLDVSWQTAAVLGLIHLLLHFAFILLVPISLITAALLIAWSRWRPERRILSGEQMEAAERQAAVKA